MAFQTELTPGSGYGNFYVDSLVLGSQWSTSPGYFGQFPVTDPVNVRYEFYGDDAMYDGYTFYSWTQAQISQFSQALETFEHVCNLSFSPSTGITDLYFLQLDASFFGGTSILGMCETPDAASDPNFGLFNRSATEWRDLRQGTTGFYVLIHELGHGLGLAHPHDGGDGDTPTQFPGVSSAWNLGLNQMNQGIWTTMSYNFNPCWVGHDSPNAYGHSMTPMALDVAALQAIYGANTRYRTGDDLYLLPQANGTGTGWSCIWDAGGVDTISNSGSEIACAIDLKSAPLVGPNAAGYVSWASRIVGGYTIANGVIIENALGGLADDLIIGNDASNQISGSLGDDLLIGAAGFDTLFGGQGSDQIQGGLNADIVFGGNGNDDLRGGSGHDQIYGGAGNDTIRGANGTDTLTGGEGSDVFVFERELDGVINIDTITDYQVSADQIQLSASIFSVFSNLIGQSVGLTPYLSYDQNTGALLYDADGFGGVSAVQFATIGSAGPPSLANEYFLIIR